MATINGEKYFLASQLEDDLRTKVRLYDKIRYQYNEYMRQEVPNPEKILGVIMYLAEKLGFDKKRMAMALFIIELVNAYPDEAIGVEHRYYASILSWASNQRGASTFSSMFVPTQQELSMLQHPPKSTKDIAGQKPRHPLNCPDCQFLGQYDIPNDPYQAGCYDLYWCTSNGSPVVESVDDQDYTLNLGIPFAQAFNNNPWHPQHEAYRRAKAFGYDVPPLR